MSLGRLETEADLERFIEERVGSLRVLVAQLQSLIRVGAGSPESVVSAPVGTLYARTDGGAGTTLYAKSSGTGATGWSALS